MVGKIYFESPKGFNPTVEVAGCICEWEGKILFLKRHADKPQGNTWGLPAGKMEKGEDPRSAAAREVHEEVGIRLDPEDLQEVVKIYIQLEDVGYVFHTFQIRLMKPATVTLEPDAHTEARWLNIQQAVELPLIIGAKEILEYYQTSAL